jgi:hypothetical protein
MQAAIPEAAMVEEEAEEEEKVEVEVGDAPPSHRDESSSLLVKSQRQVPNEKQLPTRMVHSSDPRVKTKKRQKKLSVN